MISAQLSNYRLSPRKTRIVANMIRGKRVVEAKNILTHVVKKAKHPLAGLLDSALANAKHNFKMDNEATLFVKEVRVDQGYILKRRRPMARGSAFPIKKRTSHISIVLAPIEEKKSKTARKVKKSVK